MGKENLNQNEENSFSNKGCPRIRLIWGRIQNSSWCGGVTYNKGG